MQEHWFGRLTKLEELKQAISQPNSGLYKGGIREFGEELFSYDNEQEDENE